jgi:hypothetical protein
MSTFPDPIMGEGTYLQCFGAQNLFKNVYVINHPYDLDLHFKGRYPEEMVSAGTDKVRLRWPTFKDRYSFEIPFGIILFSEDDLEVAQMPAYMHKTADKETSQLLPGSYNIGKWFRPLFGTYDTFENNNYVKIKKDEPSYYLEFKTKNKVVLKRFELTQEIKNIAINCVDLKKFITKTPLLDLYNKFIFSGTKKRLLELIKKNVIE